MNKIGEPIKDKKGSKIIEDDIPLITSKFKDHLTNKSIFKSHDHLGFKISKNQIKNDIFIPEYYNPEIEHELKKLKKTKKIISDQKIAKFGL